MSVKPEDYGRKYIYKYRPLIGVSTSKINKNTLKILKKGELFLSKPSQFNDPFDTKVDYCTNVNEEQLRAYFTGLSIRMGKPIGGIDYVIDKIKAGLIKVTDFIPKNLQADNNGIFCLSRDEKNILMWSHYAKDHTGICIGFKVHMSSESMNIKIKPGYVNSIPGFVDNLIPAIYVKYSVDKPMPYNSFIHGNNELYPHFITKSFLWEYEQEVRIMLHNNFIIKNPICLELSEIGEIIFGLRTPSILIEKVKKIMKNYFKNGNQPKLYRCVEVKGKYALDKEQI